MILVLEFPKIGGKVNVSGTHWYQVVWLLADFEVTVLRFHRDNWAVLACVRVEARVRVHLVCVSSYNYYVYVQGGPDGDRTAIYTRVFPYE